VLLPLIACASPLTDPVSTQYLDDGYRSYGGDDSRNWWCFGLSLEWTFVGMETMCKGQLRYQLDISIHQQNLIIPLSGSGSEALSQQDQVFQPNISAITSSTIGVMTTIPGTPAYPTTGLDPFRFMMENAALPHSRGVIRNSGVVLLSKIREVDDSIRGCE
jgi:hypothetical protein